MHKDDIKQILFTEEQIKKRVMEMGAEITKDYQGKNLIIISLLKGAAWFTTDLSRAIDLPVRVDFMVVSSYGNETVTSGAVKVHLDVRDDLRGKDILVVDDILDSGITLNAVVKMMQMHSPASVKTCVLCDKEERRLNDFKADYVGFKVPDEFLVGFGLDYAGDYRNLPFIGVLNSSVYARTK
ncbi:MAG: hypoxanthine phosphoribosyltransferase [Phascolarctobacterium sp.]|nr:hypoxanthine phosphoribosyltransferase [Candidatus Phascolarctobacterium caballi]MCQ2381666.1 hypoxanthine phosphoribosyltransferase [Acidaminococcaceae bacterium]